MEYFKWSGLDAKALKTAINSYVDVTTIENARLIDSQMDELIADTELMDFLDGMCRKSDSFLPIYIAFIIRQVNAAYNSSYPANLDLEDNEFKDSAMNLRKHLGDKRPTLKEFFESIRDYAEKYHPDKV